MCDNHVVTLLSLHGAGGEAGAAQERAAETVPRSIAPPRNYRHVLMTRPRPSAPLYRPEAYPLVLKNFARLVTILPFIRYRLKKLWCYNCNIHFNYSLNYLSGKFFQTNTQLTDSVRLKETRKWPIFSVKLPPIRFDFMMERSFALIFSVRIDFCSMHKVCRQRMERLFCQRIIIHCRTG